MQSRAAVMARNAASVLTSDAVYRGSTFVLYALVARQLGAYEFGQMSLALTYFYAFQVVAVAGLRTLLTREVARHPEHVGDYLRHALLVVFGASLLSLLLLGLVVAVLGYAPDTAGVILLLALALFPFSVSEVLKGLLQAFERMDYIAYVNVPANLAKVALAAVLLTGGRGLGMVIALLVGTHTVVAAAEWLLVRRRFPQSRSSSGTNLDFAAGLVRSTGPFLGIDGLVALTTSANVLLLSIMASEQQVGIYSAPAQLMVPVHLIILNVVLSAFPHMSRQHGADRQGMERITAVLVFLLCSLALPAAVGLAFVARDTLLLIYRQEAFLESVIVLQLMSVTLVFAALTNVLGQVLLASQRERTNLWITAVNAAAAFALGIPLIWRFGVVGAAVTFVLVQLIDAALHIVPAMRLVPRLSLTGLLWRPALATAVMGGALVALGGQPLPVVVAVGALTYALALAALELAVAGGPHALRRKYRSLLSG